MGQQLVTRAVIAVLDVSCTHRHRFGFVIVVFFDVVSTPYQPNRQGVVKIARPQTDTRALTGKECEMSGCSNLLFWIFRKKITILDTSSTNQAYLHEIGPVRLNHLPSGTCCVLECLFAVHRPPENLKKKNEKERKAVGQRHPQTSLTALNKLGRS